MVAVSPDNPWLGRRVLNYAHQGGAREGPSSTIWAMRRALEAGADAIEMDVHATADGQLVVCHDATVDRTTDGSGRIADLLYEEIRRLDNAFFFVPGEVAVTGLAEDRYPLRGRAVDDPELRIPLLREVLEAFPDTFLNLDIKQTAPAVPPYEEPLARLLAEFGRADDVIVASFSDAATAAFARFAPEVATSPGTAGVAALYSAIRKGVEPPPHPHRAIQVPPTFGPTVILDEAFVAGAHALGLSVHAWTIDDPAEASRLVDIGVDGIMSDRPSVIARVLDDAGVTYRPPARPA